MYCQKQIVPVNLVNPERMIQVKIYAVVIFRFTHKNWLLHVRSVECEFSNHKPFHFEFIAYPKCKHITFIQGILKKVLNVSSSMHENVQFAK